MSLRMSWILKRMFAVVFPFLGCLAFGGTGFGHAQEVIASAAQTQVTQGTTTLLAALRAIGWISPPHQGLQLSGTLTRFAGDRSSDSPIRIWAYGPRRFRMETDSADGTSALIVRDGAGQRAPAQKSAIKVSLQTAAAAHQWMAPWLMFDSVMSNYTIVKTETATISGESATGYKLSPSSFAGKASVLTKDTPYDSTFTIWLSAKGLPLRIDYLFPAEDNRFATVALSRVFQNFKSIGGVLIPMEQEQYLGPQKISRIVLDQVAPLNSADDSHFILPTAVKVQ